MSEEKDRYQILIDAVEAERKEEERYFLQLQSKKSIAEKIESGIVWYPVIIVKKYYTIGEFVEVIVERTKGFGAHKFKSGMGCELFFQASKKTGFNGVVSFVRKKKMGIIFGNDILLTQDLEKLGRTGVELVYDERPYMVMKQALANVINSQAEHIKTLRQGIRKKDRFEPYTRQDELFNINVPHLNDSQNAALNGCLKAEHIAIIHGPPGTGKTTTVVELIKQILKEEKRVLVCAPSNNAVDLLGRQLDLQGVDTLRIGNVTRVGDSIAHLTLAEKMANHNDWKHIKKVRIEANEARKHAETFKRRFGAKERANRNAMYKESRDLRKWANDLEDKLVQQIISNAKAICSTLIGLSSKVIDGLAFDTVIIDEASQALEPECWNAMLKAKRVILAGDHLQLPPTVKSSDAMDLGLEKTLLDRMTEHIHHSYLLKIQYRMNEKILAFSNMQFYDNHLQSHESVAHHAIDENPIVCIDTSGCGYQESVKGDSMSKFNEGESFIIQEWLIKHRGLLTKTSIGIISPYADQVRLLRRLQEEEEAYRDLNIEVDSIDGFQGQEKDVIIISLVRSNDKGEIGFLKDERRLNVAMTRARKKLIIIGDMSTLSSHQLFNQLAEHIEQNGHYQSAWEYMS